MITNIQGRIEQITYSDEQSGFTIARVNTDENNDTVTVVGNLMSPAPGVVLEMQGEWVDHPRYGRQFKVINYKTVVPEDVYGIRKYLGSGLVSGIGPVMAGRIVKKFGTKTLDIIENKIEKLVEVEGIGKKRIAMIGQAWDEHKDIRDLMIFLQSYGVGPGYGVKIFRKYKNRSIEAVKNNPYRLASDIVGIGFTRADTIAQKLGFPRNSEIRVEAGVLYVLGRLADRGHVYYPFDMLVIECVKILQVGRELVLKAIDAAALKNQIIIEDTAVYLSKFHFCETRAAFLFKRLTGTQKTSRTIKADNALKWVQKHLNIILAKNQTAAVKACLENKVVVITGGPGTGKTTIINAVIKIFSRLETRIMLAAPTGRAAKRMNETTGWSAATIHRLLEFSIQKGGFQKNENNPLKCDLLIVDEASMIDIILMHHLLKAIPVHTTFVLAGDVNQLPSVGPGNVLSDIIKSKAVPVIELNKIFRQSRKSRIIVNAHKINRGIVPDINLHDSSEFKKDFYFIEQKEPEKVLEIIIQLVGKRIPHRFGFDPVEDIQVLTPMHKGIIGAKNLNLRLREALNPDKKSMMSSTGNFTPGDKVMQIKNNYEKDVFNGDTGRVASVSNAEKEIVVSFDGRNIIYSFTDLDEIVLAYAVSIHKSQGSEYPAVVIPVMTQHYILLQRNLIYTAVTRAMKLVVMVGTGRALAMGIKNDKTQKRFTRLSYRLL